MVGICPVSLSLMVSHHRSLPFAESDSPSRNTLFRPSCWRLPRRSSALWINLRPLGNAHGPTYAKLGQFFHAAADLRLRLAVLQDSE